MRLRWLAERRPDADAADATVAGRWRFVADEVDLTVEATPHGRVVVRDGDDRADCVMAGPGRVVLAFLLGRADVEDLTVTGPPDLAARFRLAFPGP